LKRGGRENFHLPGKTRKRLFVKRTRQLVLWSLFGLLASSGASAQLSFYTTVDMALRNSPQVRASAAEVARAEAGISESVAVYKPSLVLGSSLGWTYGFPLGQPEVFSLSAQSLAFSFSQRDYIRSAQRSLKSAQLELEDTRQQVILDAALDYIELAKVVQQIAALDQENGYAQKLIQIVDQRVAAGRDSKMELTRARLTEAQVALKRIHLVDQADLLRTRLAHLTGLNAPDLTPQPESIPPPRVPDQVGNLDAAVTLANSGVQAAYAAAKAKLYTAFGDSRQNNRPIVTFAASYGLFATSFNNYAVYYPKIQPNNLGAGVQVSIPFFDSTRRARAKGSSADAVHALAQADLLRDQTSEQVLQLQKSLAELDAQEQVAELEDELAQDQLQAVTAELQSGNGNPQAVPLTPKDEQQALLNERDQYINTLDARFQLTQARLGLLRSLGEIDTWAKIVPAPRP
jgi:outer membrane protein TolC